MRIRILASITFILLMTTLSLLASRAPTILTVSLSNGQVGAVYYSKLQSRYGSKPYQWSIVSGSLPTSLSLRPSKGEIYGVPSVAGTYNFTVQLLDSSKRAVTQALSIQVISGTPVILPVSITTTSIPNGTSGSLYNATLQAANGTTPYAWSLLSGSLPLGLSLNSSGVISGTPTIVGDSTFVAQVTDASSAINTHTYSISVISPSGAYIVSDSFENGNVSLWQNTSYAAETSIVHSGVYAAGAHYVICGDSTNSACGAWSQDIGCWVGKLFNTGLSPFNVRWYVYVKSPEVGGTTDGVQRKLIYIWDNTNSPAIGWSLFLKTEGGTGTLPLVFNVQNSPLGGTTTAYYPALGGVPANQAVLAYNTWNSIEIQVQNDTSSGVTWNGTSWSGVCNGVLKLWLNGVAYTTINGAAQDISTSACLNLGTSNKLRYFQIGQQTNRFNYDPIDEYRYLDDIVINDSYIGP